MRVLNSMLIAVLLGVWIQASHGGQAGARPAPQAPAEGASIARGEYIVMRVAMCVQCHSERDAAGHLIPTRLLEGGPMPVGSPFPGQVWAFMAPKLAGVPAGYTPETLAHFLQTGDTGREYRPRPPMPPFRMTASDAASVAAYLDSLR